MMCVCVEGRSILFLQPVYFLPYLCMKWCSFCLFKGPALKEKATSKKGTFLPQWLDYCATDCISFFKSHVPDKTVSEACRDHVSLLSLLLRHFYVTECQHGDSNLIQLHKHSD